MSLLTVRAEWVQYGGVGVSCTDLILTPICGIVPFLVSQLACNVNNWYINRPLHWNCGRELKFCDHYSGTMHFKLAKGSESGV